MRLIGWTSSSVYYYFERGKFFSENRKKCTMLQDVHTGEILSAWKTNDLYLTNYGIDVLCDMGLITEPKTRKQAID